MSAGRSRPFPFPFPLHNSAPQLIYQATNVTFQEIWIFVAKSRTLHEKEELADLPKLVTRLPMSNDLDEKVEIIRQFR
jgi:hypothetical protein